jgi:hypothetical protein
MVSTTALQWPRVATALGRLLRADMRRPRAVAAPLTGHRRVASSPRRPQRPPASTGEAAPPGAWPGRANASFPATPPDKPCTVNCTQRLAHGKKRTLRQWRLRQGSCKCVSHVAGGHLPLLASHYWPEAAPGQDEGSIGAVLVFSALQACIIGEGAQQCAESVAETACYQTSSVNVSPV